jgi:hypothetical protein
VSRVLASQVPEAQRWVSPVVVFEVQLAQCRSAS